jgi:hypothetical protein
MSGSVTGEGFWANRARDGIVALSEVTFPENELGAPDWKSTDMVRRTLEYLDELPPKQRRLLTLLFVFVELGALFLVLGFRRFSRIPRTRRAEIIRGWRHSRLLPLRVLGDAIKATTTMMYMSHPSVIAYIGEYRVCSHEEDPLRIDVRPDALTRMGDGA